MPNDWPEAVKRVTAQWTIKILTITTVIGRLCFLGSLRDPHTGVYIHHGMSTAVGDETHTILLKSHQKTFAAWRRMSFPNQVKDIEGFVDSLILPDRFSKDLDGDAKIQIVLNTWKELEPYRNFLPLFVPPIEKSLFLTRLDGILATLTAQSDAKTNAVGSYHSPDLDD